MKQVKPIKHLLSTQKSLEREIQNKQAQLNSTQNQIYKYRLDAVKKLLTDYAFRTGYTLIEDIDGSFIIKTDSVYLDTKPSVIITVVVTSGFIEYCVTGLDYSYDENDPGISMCIKYDRDFDHILAYLNKKLNYVNAHLIGRRNTIAKFDDTVANGVRI